MKTQQLAAPSGIPIRFMGLPFGAEEEARRGRSKIRSERQGAAGAARVLGLRSSASESHHLDRTYHRLRADGRGPVEMRPGSI